MKKPRLIKKSKETIDFVPDISKAFTLLSKTDKLYFITLTGIPTIHIQDLNFQLTNKFFNTIHKDYKNSFEYLNYLFIIEYGGMISKESESFIKNLGIHSHCLVNTSITKQQLEVYINTSFKRIPNYKIQDISKSDSKEDLLNYLLKQDKTRLLTKDSYNYKIVTVNY